MSRAGQGFPAPSPMDKFILDEYVRYVGDEVALVAAANERIAEDALKLIEVEYEVLEPVLDYKTAYQNKNIIHPEDGITQAFEMGFRPKENVAATYEMEVGDVEKSLKECDVVIEHSVETQAQSHSMMEPHCANARLDDHNRLVIYSSTQTPFHMRRILTKTLGLPLNKVRMIKPRVGGGFGGKQAFHCEFFVALVTLRTGLPARMSYTREEVFASAYTRHPMKIDIKIGAMKDGTIKAIDCRSLSDTGAYGEHALTVFMIVGSKVLPLYNKVDSVRFGGRVVYTNHVPAGAFRGYGAIQGNYALEIAIDMLAEKLNDDPIEIRLKSLNWPSFLREGMTVSLELLSQQQAQAMVIPSAALQQSQNQYWLWLAKDGKAVRQNISIGQRAADKVQVISGLANNSQIILSDKPLQAGHSISIHTPATKGQ